MKKNFLIITILLLFFTASPAINADEDCCKCKNNCLDFKQCAALDCQPPTEKFDCKKVDNVCSKVKILPETASHEAEAKKEVKLFGFINWHGKLKCQT